MIWSYPHQFYKYKTFLATKNSIKAKAEYLQGLQIIYGLAEQDSAVTFQFNVYCIINY